MRYVETWMPTILRTYAKPKTPFPPLIDNVVTMLTKGIMCQRLSPGRCQEGDLSRHTKRV